MRGSTLMIIVSLQSTVLLAAEDPPPELVRLTGGDTLGIKACKAPGVVTCQKAEIIYDVLGAQNVTFPWGKVLTLNIVKNTGYDYEGTDGSEVSIFVGRVPGSSNKTVTASINYNNPDKLFKIESCMGLGCHVLIEQGDDQNHPAMIGVDVEMAGLPEMMSPYKKAFEVPSLKEQRTNTIVTVHWYYTNKLAAVTDNVQNEIELLTSNANTGYLNSGIPLELQIKCIELLPNFKETSKPSKMLRFFRTAKGSQNATKNSADVALLLISGPASGVCGIAYLNAYRNGYAFGWVGKGCQTIVTGHEVGHMFGAYHNKEIASGADEGFEYGYLITGGYASIMAYANGDHPTWINKFSSPDLIADNGQPTGVANLADNKRTHMERKLAMSQLGDESSECGAEPCKNIKLCVLSVLCCTTGCSGLCNQSCGLC